MTIVSADGMEVLASARTVYFVFMKAALVNVVADMNENCAWPNWTSETEAVRTWNASRSKRSFTATRSKKEISTIMGIEDVFLLRVGDADIPMNQVQVAFCTKDEGSTYRGYVTSSSLKLQPYRWYHIAVTFDKGDICVYLDGKLKASGQTVTDKKDEHGNPVLIDKINFAVPHSDESDGKPRCFWIGYSYDDKRSFDGMMGEIRVWNKGAHRRGDQCEGSLLQDRPRIRGSGFVLEIQRQQHQGQGRQGLFGQRLPPGNEEQCQLAERIGSRGGLDNHDNTNTIH